MRISPRPTGAPVEVNCAVLNERRQLINLSYRLLGNLTDAEDVVQEAFARWFAMSVEERRAIKSPGAWLNTVASRICLNLLTSARYRRESYVGEWIPEPIPDTREWCAQHMGGACRDPADQVTLDESVTIAFLVVLDSMTPAERVAFILHDVFRYPFAEISEIVGRTPTACRQLATSARRRLRTSTTPAISHQKQDEVVHAFKQAWEEKDVDALISLLDPSVTAVADSGGLATTFPHPIEGRVRIMNTWIELANRLTDDIRLLECRVNGQTGVVALHNDVVATVFAFEVADDLIKHIWVVRNPEKLHFWARSQ